MTPVIANYHNALLALDSHLDRLRRELERASAALPCIGPAFAILCGEIDHAGNRVRDTVTQLAGACEVPVPTWTTRAELEQVATGLCEQLATRLEQRWREQLRRLADQLQRGQVVNPRTQHVIPALDVLRQQACAAVAALAEGTETCRFPGPDDGDWLAYVWALPGDTLATFLQPLHLTVPALYEFLLSVNPDNWHTRSSPESMPEAGAHAVTEAVMEVLAPPVSSLPLVPSVVVPELTPEPPRPTPKPVAPLPKETKPKSDSIGVVEMRRRTLASPMYRPNKTPSREPKTPPPVKPAPAVVEPPASLTPEPLTEALESPAELPEAETFLDVIAVEPLPDIVEPLTESTFEEPAWELTPEPLPAVLVPAVVPEAEITAVPLATDAEIVAHCRKGQFLQATLLTFGRECANEPCEPDAQALLVTHHVVARSPLAPWPEWCHEVEQAMPFVRAHPVTAQWYYLAAQCQTIEQGLDPFAVEVSDVLREAFKDVAAVRVLLDIVNEVKYMPGIIEQIRTREPTTDPRVAYQTERAAFFARASRANKLRPQAAYHHRQDLFMNQMPAGAKLQKLLHEGAPHPDVFKQHPDIDAYLAQNPEAVVTAWLASMGGRVALYGNDRLNLKNQAAEYLQLAAKAWHAARKFTATRPKRDDVEQYRTRLQEALPAAREQGHAQPWCALLERILGGLGQC